MTALYTTVKSSIAIGLCALAAGCTTAPTRVDYQNQTQSLVQTLAPWSSQSTEQASLPLTTLVNSAELTQLVEQALIASPSIEAQRLALAQSVLATDIAASANRPSVSASGSVSEEKDSDTSLSAKLDVSWQLDIWQSLADEVSLSELSAVNQQLALQGLKDSYVAQVMQEWLTIKLSQQGLATQVAINENLNKTLALVDQQFALGSAELSDLNTARLDLASSHVDVEVARTELNQAINQMRALLGDNTYQPNTSAELPHAEALTAQLSSQNLGRRPDLQQAFVSIQQAQLSSDIAYKAMLPTLDLGAALTSSGDSVSSLLSASPVWSLLAQLSAPLYQSGALEKEAESADLAIEIAYADYKDTLWTAVTEVNDALEQERSLNQQINQTEQIIALSQQTFDQTERNYQAGAATLEDYLDAQRTLLELNSQLNSLTHQTLQNRISLGLALGLGAY